MPRDWPVIRAFVIWRDKGICYLCGKPGADTADHIVPSSKGGLDAAFNLRAAHRKCNQKRGNHTLPRPKARRSRFDG